MHASLYCLVLFICSVSFTASRNVDYRRRNDTREGRKEGTRGEGKEDRRKYARHMNFQKLLTTTPLLLQNTLKLTYSTVKTKKLSEGNTLTPASGEGRSAK